MDNQHQEGHSPSQLQHGTDMGHEPHEIMEQRRVTRPQMSGKDGHHDMKMSPADRLKMLHMHHQ